MVPTKAEIVGRVLRGTHAKRGQRKTETLLRKLPGKKVYVGEEEVGVSLSRCSNLVKRSLQQAKVWHNQISTPCHCLSIAPRCVVGGQEHLVLRHREQWSQVLPEDQVPVVCQNARNTVLPDEGALDDVLHKFIESVSVHFPPDPLVDPPVSHTSLLQRWGQDKIQAETHAMGLKFPHCMIENIDCVSSTLKALGLYVGVWDKDPTKIFASCPAPMETHSIAGVLACGDFKIVGVSSK